MSDVKARLEEVFRDVFDDDSVEISASTTASDIDGWDSLNHVNLVVAVEKKFAIKFTTKEVNKLANVGEFIELIERKLAG
jgi:acyl carrier protein